MNKHEFLEKLRAELTVRRAVNITEIMTDFESHFNDALKDGQSEGDIVRSLGEPAEIAEQCAQDIQSEASDKADVFVNLRSSNLIIEQWDGSGFDVRVTRRGASSVHDDEDFIIERGGNGLRIEQRRTGSAVAWLLSVFEICTVHVSVPKSFGGGIRIRLSSGNLEMSGVTASGLAAEMFSGNIRLNKFTASCMELSTRSGKIKLSDCAGDVNVKGASGSISVASHKGNVNAKSKSGNVNIEADALVKPSEISTNSGCVKLRLDRLDERLELSCVSGNINFHIHELNADLTAKTTSGNVTGYLKDGTKADFRINSSLVKNEFLNDTSSAGLPVVILSSKSGLARLKKL